MILSQHLPEGTGKNVKQFRKNRRLSDIETKAGLGQKIKRGTPQMLMSNSRTEQRLSTFPETIILLTPS
jgi:hypothetical protein